MAVDSSEFAKDDLVVLHMAKDGVDAQVANLNTIPAAAKLKLAEVEEQLGQAKAELTDSKVAEDITKEELEESKNGEFML